MDCKVHEHPLILDSKQSPIVAKRLHVVKKKAANHAAKNIASPAAEQTYNSHCAGPLLTVAAEFVLPCPERLDAAELPQS